MRVTDDDAEVLEALYSAPALFLPLLSNKVEQFLENVQVSTVGNHGAARKVVRLHLGFLSSHFLERYPGSVAVVLERIFFPYLLFSKARLKTCVAAWEAISNSPPLASSEVLSGAVEVATSEGENAAKNILIAKKVAGTIASYLAS